MTTDWQPLLDLALQARQHSYCPISGYAVGSALRTEAGDVFAGTNVEEATFTSTIHAEQGAVAQMITSKGRQKITAVVVVGAPKDNDSVESLSAPCGHCRQLLSEFTDDHTSVAVFTPQRKLLWEGNFGQLLPLAFRLP